MTAVRIARRIAQTVGVLALLAKFRDNLHAFTSHRDNVRRYFATYRIGGDDRRCVEGHIEIAHHRKPTSAGFRFHIGDRGSETPVDGMLDLGWVALYWGFDAPGLGRLCERIGGGHKRDLSLRIFGGSLWWNLWYDDQGGNDSYHRCDSWRRPGVWPWSRGRRKHRGWMCLRDGNIDLNPIDALWGNSLWLKDETFTAQTARALVPVGDFDGDEYEVDFTLERRTVRRQHGPAWAQRVKRVDYSADAVGCIPVRNHAWKGDEILGWGAKVSEQSVKDGTWIREAVAGTVDLVRRDRKHYDYRPTTTGRPL